MATKSIKLEKNIISNEESNSLYNKSLNKLIKSNIEIDEKRIEDIYNIVFYNTPKKGTYSHTSIVQRIYDYIHTSLIQSKENEIERLTDNLIQKNEELDDKQSPSIRQHPVYPNGSFLIAGENGEKYDGLDTVYIMQEGYKRPFSSEPMYQNVRKCLDLPSTVGPTLYGDLFYVPIDELNNIDLGATITTTADLNLTGTDIDVEDVNVYAKFSSYLLRVSCKGTEVEDIADALVLEPDAQFFYDEGCTIKYYNAVGPDGPQSIKSTRASDGSQLNSIGGTTTLYLAKGQVKNIRIGRDNDLQSLIDGVPSNPDYQVNNVVYNGSNVQDYIREWGPGTKYNGIVQVEGNVRYRELGRDKKTYTNPSNYKVLNGLPPRFEIAPDPVGEEMSIYGTRIIYKGGSGLYGDQMHFDDVQNSIFDDPTSDYYRPEFYGQPIFKDPFRDDYLVFLGCVPGGQGELGDASIFLSLKKKQDYNYSNSIQDIIANIGNYGFQSINNFNLPEFGSGLSNYVASYIANGMGYGNLSNSDLISSFGDIPLVVYPFTKLIKGGNYGGLHLPIGRLSSGWSTKYNNSGLFRIIPAYDDDKLGGGNIASSLRYKGHKNVGTYGFNGKDHDQGVDCTKFQRHPHMNVIQYGFIWPGYMAFHDNPEFDYTPWK